MHPGAAEALGMPDPVGEDASRRRVVVND